MSQPMQRVTLICPPHIRSVRDTEQILLIDECQKQLYSLCDMEAAVWDWLSLGYTYPKLTAMLSAYCGAPTEDAEKLLNSMLAEWHRVGVLQQKDTPHG